MIYDIEINRTLTMLDGLYNQPAVSNDMAIMYSKLATMELCGWIEDSFDAMAESFVKRKTTTNEYQNIFNRLKEDIHGFNWNSHFRKLIMPVIGIANMEAIHVKLRQPVDNIAILIGELKYLEDKRNDAAHKQFINRAVVYDTPSLCLGKLTLLFPILQSIQNEIDAIT